MNAPVAEGQVLAGKYRVERVLGQGGMGVVVAAMHQQLQQRVAIKFLLRGADPDTVERFLREGRAAVRLKSEHVARVIDVGELEDGAPYMVMEYLEGIDLSQLLRRSGPPTIEDAVTYVLHACEAIAEAHAAGIIHRDLKPANLFLTTAADGSHTVKVLDFGISKAGLDAPESTDGTEPALGLTKTGMMVGSPLYMSPEQMKSARSVDLRADLWSMGAILYQLLTGRVPFETTSLPELILMVNTQEPPPLRNFRPELPEALEAAALRCLRRAREERFANIGELALAIAPFASDEAQASVPKILRTLGMPATALGFPRPSGISSPSLSVLSMPGSIPPGSLPTTGRPSSPPGATASGAPGTTLPSARTSTPPAVARTAEGIAGIAGQSVPPPADAAPTAAGWAAAGGSRPPAARGSATGKLVAGAVALLTVVGGAAFAVSRMGAKPPEPTASPAAENAPAPPPVLPPSSAPTVEPVAQVAPPEVTPTPSASPTAAPTQGPSTPPAVAPQAQRPPQTTPTKAPTGPSASPSASAAPTSTATSTNPFKGLELH